MNKLLLCVTDGKYNYGIYIVKNSSFSARSKIISNSITQTEIDSAFWHYLHKELVLSRIYRIHFIHHWTRHKNNHLIIYLLPTQYNLIDYDWNDRIYQLVRERCELDHALSWLSTLGGAFSALGDYFPNCAETAGKISFHQLKLALRLDDASIAARCRLYLSLSLIQKKRYKLARKIIENEFKNAQKTSLADPRLLNMCRGIWAKFQYEYSLYKKSKKKSYPIELFNFQQQICLN